MQAQAAAGRPLRGALLVSAFTLLSRITGLFREAVLARFLGTGMAADAFGIAILLPNLLRRLVGEGAVNSAFVPVYARHSLAESAEETRVFAEKFVTLWLILLGAFTLLALAVSGPTVAVAFSAGTFHDPVKAELTVSLTRLLCPYLPLIGVVAVAAGILNARGLYGAAAFAPVLHNLAFVGAALLLVPRLAPEAEGYGIALAVLIGGVAQVALLLPPLWALGIRPRPRLPWDHPGVREVLRLLVPGTVGAGVYQINVVVCAALAARLEGGAVAALGYSNRLMEFVLGVFVFGLSTVGLTVLSGQAARGDEGAFRRTTSDLLRAVVFITVPSALGLLVLARPILQLLYGGGRFDDLSLGLTVGAFRWHALGIPFIGANRVLVSFFHARKDLKTPVKIAAVNLVVNLGLAWWLSGTALGFAGIALASTIAAAVQTASLLAVFLLREPRMALPGIWSTTLKTAAAAVLMAGLCRVGLQLSPEAQGKTAQALRVAWLVAGGAAAYFALAWCFRIPELRRLWKR
jgi:putative peptidoglycan lipid II flippase